MSRLRGLASLILVFSTSPAWADPTVAAALDPRPPRVLSLSAALLTETAKFQPSGLAPGFSAGVELPWVARTHHSLFQTLAVSYFHRADVEHALVVGTELGYRYTLGVGLFLEV